MWGAVSWGGVVWGGILSAITPTPPTPTPTPNTQGVNLSNLGGLPNPLITRKPRSLSELIADDSPLTLEEIRKKLREERWKQKNKRRRVRKRKWVEPGPEPSWQAPFTPVVVTPGITPDSRVPVSESPEPESRPAPVPEPPPAPLSEENRARIKIEVVARGKTTELLVTLREKLKPPARDAQAWQEMRRQVEARKAEIRARREATEIVARLRSQLRLEQDEWKRELNRQFTVHRAEVDTRQRELEAIARFQTPPALTPEVLTRRRLNYELDRQQRRDDVHDKIRAWQPLAWAPEPPEIEAIKIQTPVDSLEKEDEDLLRILEMSGEMS